MEVRCGEEVMLNTVTKSVHGAHLARSFGIALDSRLAEPPVGFGEILLHAAAV
jgi:hypothetical protein